jgi:Cu+-exporting ATPase
MTLLTTATLCVFLLAASPGAALASSSDGPQESKAAAPAQAQERDPICNMTVDTAKAREAGRTSVYEGKTFYFCNDSCKKQFDADPAKYAQKKAGDSTASTGTCCCHRGEGRGSGGMCCRHQ